MLKHVVNSLTGKKFIWMRCLTEKSGLKFLKSPDRVPYEKYKILTKGHQRRVVNSDDNQVFRFQPSMLFCFLLCRVLMQLGNHLVRKIFEMQLVLKHWSPQRVRVRREIAQIGIARESTYGPIKTLTTLALLESPGLGWSNNLGIWHLSLYSES